jgi:hypothetical protein
MSTELNKVMLEGQKKTLEAMEKQVAGTITSEESTRLAMLNGNLLALAGQAVELGFDPKAVIAQTEAAIAYAEAEDEEVGEELFEVQEDSEEELSDEEYEQSNTCYCGDLYCDGL